MDPQALLQQRLQQSQQNEKTFSDRLRERRGFVQGQEQTASPIFERLLEAPNGEARVASTDIINPLRGFTTENTRFVQEAEAGLDRATSQTDSLLQALIQLSENQKDRSLSERKLALEEASMGAVFNPQTGRYEINQNALTPDVIKSETDLRQEFNGLVKDSKFNEVRAAYEKVKNTSPNAAGDLSLIFAYMKMLDPGSVIRESEFETAETAQPLIERYKLPITPDRAVRLYKGERLAPETREAFKREAAIIYNGSAKTHNSLVDSYNELAAQYGANPKRVTNQFGTMEPVPIPKGKGLSEIQTESRSIGQNILDFLFGGPGSLVPRGQAQSRPGGSLNEQILRDFGY